MDVSTAVLSAHDQYFRGYSILVLQEHATELFDLDAETRARFVEDANRLALALKQTFNPLKMNYCLLGNTVAHLHWHLIPRYASDPDPKTPIWQNPFPQVEVTEEELQKIADEIRGNL